MPIRSPRTTGTRFPGGRPAARLFVVGLALARTGAGGLEALSPETFLRLIGAPPPGPAGSLGFRMKGGRDVALGLLALRSLGDDREMAAAAAAAVLVDGVDGLAVAIDRGRTLAPPVDTAGAVLGIGVAAVAVWAARTLRRGT